MEFVALRVQMQALSTRIYLNTGTSGPVPLAAAKAQQEELAYFLNEGFASPPAIERYVKTLAHARATIERAIGAPKGSVALMHSASEGIGTVASGIDWQCGDEVIICDLEHVSGVAPWARLSERRGVKVINLRSDQGYIEAAAFRDAITDRTRLICISHVSYATGAVLPVEEVCAAARERGVPVVVDGAQGPGNIAVDVGRIGCAFYALPGQKWLLGPEGTGGLYVNPDALDMIEPTRIGWASVRHETSEDGSVVWHADARRLESGTVHAPAFAALVKGIELLEAIGWERIAERNLALAMRARERLEKIEGARILTPASHASGLLTFAIDGRDPDEIVKRLWDEHRIVIRSIPHPKALRASFHAFNDESDVVRLAQALRGIVVAG